MDNFKMEKERILVTPMTLFMEYILLRYNNYLKNKLNDIDITQGELTFLFNIFYNKKISQRELADLLFVSEAYVTKMVKKLENKNYVKRNIDKNNKSRKIIYLTNEGELLVYHILKLTYEWESKISYTLNDDTQDKLKELLYELINNSVE